MNDIILGITIFIGVVIGAILGLRSAMKPFEKDEQRYTARKDPGDKP